MENVLSTPDLQDFIFKKLVFRDLNHLRCANKGLQRAVSIHTGTRIGHFHKRFQKRLDKGSEEGDRLEIVSHIPHTIHHVTYSVLYSYYHTIIKLSMMTMPEDMPIDLLEFCRSLKDISTNIRYTVYEKVVHWVDETPFLRMNREILREQNLYQIMCHHYLGGDHVPLTEDTLHLENKLLPMV